MEIIDIITPRISFLWEVGLPFVIALTILVFVHEMGHYSVARFCDVRVEVFSIGFGPEIFGWNDKADTRWKICMIPLGGYVKMFGEGEEISEDNDDSRKDQKLSDEEKAVSFQYKTLLQRSAIVFAGPLINFLFAIIAFAGIFMTVGLPNSNSDQLIAKIGKLSAGAPAVSAGLKVGDQIIEIDTKKVVYFSDLQEIIKSRPNKKLVIKALRDGREIIFELKTSSRLVKNESGESMNIGLLGVSVAQGDITYVRQGVFQSIYLGIQRTYNFTLQILKYIKDIFIGKQSTDELGGIIRIAQISGQVAELGLVSFISFLAILSVNLGLINLFPIPMLDGGHLVFYAIEAVIGRPLSSRIQEYLLKFGLLLVIFIFLFVTWNDLVHLKFFEFIITFFT
ncbi:MAG: RIP metalloprotease RseP [Rhodospirillaceae bacterium]|nr:RIP metalloprotease RseP [Rhodospirillaceae bacterium]